jgi:hypothetical protein
MLPALLQLGLPLTVHTAITRATEYNLWDFSLSSQVLLHIMSRAADRVFASHHHTLTCAHAHWFP